MTKILVIEDEPLLREHISQVLGFEDYEVYSAPDGSAGIDMAVEVQPDLIVSDIMLPGADGYQVLEAVRSVGALARTPFIFLSAKADKGDVRQGMELGAEDYLTKPFEFPELLRAIETQLEKKHALDELANQKRDELASDLLRMIPHEMRTPLTALLGYSEQLEISAASFSPEIVSAIGGSMKKAAMRLHRLIENYVKFSHLELIGLDPVRRAQLLEAVTGNAHTTVRYYALNTAQRMNRLEDMALFVDEVGPIHISESYLSTIVDELVDNACKFSQAGQKMEVSLIAANGVIELKVRDAGMGMPVGALTDVGPFVQFDREQHEQQGSGLGLAIVRSLTELHGGTLQIDSEPGAGTCVTVRLPAA